MQIFFNLYNSRLRIFNGGLDSVVHLYLVSSYEIGLLAGLQGWTRIFFLRANLVRRFFLQAPLFVRFFYAGPLFRGGFFGADKFRPNRAERKSEFIIFELS